MSCEESRDLLLLHAAGDPDARAHLLSGCPACAGSLAEAEATLAHLALALTPVAPPARVRERLMARVASERQAPVGFRRPEATHLGPRRPSFRDRWLRPALAASVAAVVTYLGVSIPLKREAAAFEARLATQSAQIRELSAAVAGSAATLRVLRSPAVDVVALVGQGGQASARGRIFWDRSRGEWHFFASALRPAGEGRTYELWFINAAQQKIPAGTFEVDASGEGMLIARVPEGVGPLALAAVTDEPAGGSAQPTGSMHLAGALPAAS